MMQFPCVKCGWCCRILKDVPFLADYHNGDGVCRHLSGNVCDIYGDRPEICNVETMYNVYFKEEMTEYQFIMANLKCCLRLARKAGALKSYKQIKDVVLSARYANKVESN